MRHSLISLLFVSLTTVGIAAPSQDPIPGWMKNYKKLIAVLQKTGPIGACAVSVSGDPTLPAGSQVINILKNPGGMMGFIVTPPALMHGRSQVELDSKHRLVYRESDMVGWTNLILQLDRTNEKVLSLVLNKTLPNGSVYSTGAECGKL